MFVCVFAKKVPALASQSCCEVSRPRAVGEYEYRLLLARSQGKPLKPVSVGFLGGSIEITAFLSWQGFCMLADCNYFL